MSEETQIKEMHEYGYLWDGMKPITLKTALDHFNDKKLVPGCESGAVCLLYEDDSESIAETQEEIIEHAKRGGLLGVERDNAEDYPDAKNDNLPQ